MERFESSDDAEYCAVTVVCGPVGIDVALPAGVPSGDLIPGLLRMLEPAVPTAADHRWVLTPVGGVALAPAETLGQAGVVHGDVLTFVAREPGERHLPPATGSLRDQVEDIVGGQDRAWNTSTSARFAAWLGTIGGAVLLVPAASAGGGPATAALAATVAIVLGLLAVVSARRSTTAAAAGLVVGCLWAGLAGWSWHGDAPIAVLAGIGGSAAVSSPAALPSAIALGAAAGALLAAAATTGYPAALLHTAACTTLAGSAIVLAALTWTRLPPVQIAAAAALVAVLLIGAVPRLGLALGGLVATGGVPLRPALDIRVLRAGWLVTGSIVGLSAAAVLGVLPAAMSADGWQQLLAGAVGIGLLLRSRVYSQIPHVLAPRIAGVLVLLFLFFGIVRVAMLPDAVRILFPIALFAAGTLNACVIPAMTPLVRARVGRLLDIAEQIGVVAAVVLAVGVLGLFGWVGAVTGGS